MMFSTEFLQQVPLEWADILWGYDRQLLGWRTPVKVAQEKQNRCRLEVELGGLGKDQDWRVRDILEDLASRHPVAEDASKDKWLYLSLLWLYDNRFILEDVFKQLDLLYADFDYPDEISSFIPFMPPSDGYNPSEHNEQENRDRLLLKWREYLDEAKASFSGA